MFSTAVAAVLCLLTVTARAQCPLQPLDPTSFNALKTSTGWSKITDALQKVDAAAAQFAKDNVGSGLAVVVTYQDTLVHQSSMGYARANIAPDYNRTIWRIASITKVFTALQLLQLADRDLVHLDSAITDLVPTLTSVPGITLRSLATQMSGMVREVPLPCRGDDSDCAYTTEQMIPALNKLPVLWKPNRRPAYSNLGFSLLGRALENVSGGKKYEQHVKEEILAPLGMHNSGFDLENQDVLDHLAVGTDEHLKPTRLGWASPNGEMYVTAADMGRFMMFVGSRGMSAYYNATRVLTEKMMSEWFLPRYIYPGGADGFGLPWEIVRSAHAQQSMLFTKSGNIDQFGSELSFDPETGVGLWVVANTPGPAATEFNAGISDTVFGAFTDAIAAAVADVPLPSSATQFVGTYKGYARVLLANMTITVAYQSPPSPSAAGAGSGNQQQLVASFAWATGGGLAYLTVGPSSDVLVMQMPGNLPIPCLMVGELAWNGEHLVLGKNGGSVTIPNLMPGTIFTKQ